MNFSKWSPGTFVGKNWLIELVADRIYMGSYAGVRLEYFSQVFDPVRMRGSAVNQFYFYLCISNVCDFTARKLLNQFNGWYEG